MGGMVANSPCDREGRHSSYRENFRSSPLENHPWRQDSDLDGLGLAVAVAHGARLRIRYRRESMDRLLEAGLRGRQTLTGRHRGAALPDPQCMRTMLVVVLPFPHEAKPRVRWVGATAPPEDCHKARPWRGWDMADTMLLEAESATGRDP